MPPVLYSFRRCPYAMRARMAIAASGIACELREVVLRDKPQAMLDASPKGTVPVLVLPDQVIDESLDVMRWALTTRDPHGWLEAPGEGLVSRCDEDFKQHLDRYKYPDRYEDVAAGTERDHACDFIGALEARLERHSHLQGDAARFADVGIFPFVRQFAAVDRQWWAGAPYPRVRAWLDRWLASPLFALCMTKYDKWEPGSDVVTFPPVTRPTPAP